MILSGGADSGYVDVSVVEAKQLMEKNADLIIIDVSPYYEEGHLPGAISYYPNSVLWTATSVLDKDMAYLVYCHADEPSRVGAQTLIDAGFDDVYRLEGNFDGWKDAGYEVEY